MDSTHPLLRKQIEETLGSEEDLAPDVQQFVNKINKSYRGFEVEMGRRDLITDSFSGAVFVADSQLEEIYYFNCGSENLLGVTADDLQHEPYKWLSNVENNDRKRLREKIESGIDEPVVSEFQLVDGRWLRGKFIPCAKPTQNKSYVVGIMQDITTVRKYQQSLKENIEVQRDKLFKKMPARLRKNLDVVKKRMLKLRVQAKEATAARECKHCLMWFQALNIAYENGYHYSSSDEVEMFTFLSQYSQYAMALFAEEIEPPRLEVQAVSLEFNQAISCGIIQFELVTTLHELDASGLICRLRRNNGNCEYSIVVEKMAAAPHRLQEIIASSDVKQLVEEELEGEIEYPDSIPGELQVVFSV